MTPCARCNESVDFEQNDWAVAHVAVAYDSIFIGWVDQLYHYFAHLIGSESKEGQDPRSSEGKSAYLCASCTMQLREWMGNPELSNKSGEVFTQMAETSKAMTQDALAKKP